MVKQLRAFDSIFTVYSKINLKTKITEKDIYFFGTLIKVFYILTPIQFSNFLKQ